MIFFVLIKFILFIIKFLAKNSILQAIFAVGVIASSHANTVIVTGQGIDKVTKQYFVVGSKSSVKHDPGFSFDGQVHKIILFPVPF